MPTALPRVLPRLAALALLVLPAVAGKPSLRWQGKTYPLDALPEAMGGSVQRAREHFERVVDLEPELVIFGAGARLRFPPPQYTQGLLKRGIGVEVMDTAAACRTYNVLLGEGRRVGLAVLPV